MAENQNQSPGAEEQPIDDTLKEPSIGMVYDKEKDQAKVLTRNPDGSFDTVDPTPENESLFFIMDQRIPANFMKNLQKYYANPNINIFVLPRRGLDRMKDALKRYWKNTKSDDVKLYYNYKLRADGQYECKVKSYGIPVHQMPWDTLSQMGFSYGSAMADGSVDRWRNYQQSGMRKLKYLDNVLSFVGDGKVSIKKKGDVYKADIKTYAHQLDEELFGQKFTKTDMDNLAKYGNLGRVFPTPYGDKLISRDFDTRQLEYIDADRIYLPKKLYGTELRPEDIDAFKRGEARPISVKTTNGEMRELLYQYNVVFHKLMEVMTRQQRNELASEQRRQNEVEDILSRPVAEQQQAPKQGEEQAPAPEQGQTAQAPEAAGQGQTPTLAPEQGPGGQAPAPGQPTPTPEAAGQGQDPTPDLFGQGQQEPGQKPPAPTQGQDPKPPVPGQKPQGQEPNRKGPEKENSPRPEVKTPEGSGKGQRKGKHV